MSKVRVLRRADQTARVPCSIEVEQALIGLALVDPQNTLDRTVELLESNHFFDSRHVAIWRVLERRWRGGEPIDFSLVVDDLQRRGDLERAGGLVYLTELLQRGTSAAFAEQYAMIVRQQAFARELLETFRLGSQMIMEGGDPFEVADDIDRRFYQAQQRLRPSGGTPVGRAIEETIAYIEAIASRPGDVTGIPTGFEQIDRITTGWHEGELIVVAARPSMGKTSLALRFAIHAARCGHPVLLFSLEMGRQSVSMRILSTEARVPLQALRKGQLSDEEWKRLAHALSRLDELPLLIDDRSGIGVSDIKAAARRMQREMGLEMIVIDYLQLLVPERFRRDGTREQEVAAIAQGLKRLAGELHVPIIALSQLSRAVENRHDKRPQLSDLRESGSIEQEADVVLMLYRPEYYGITIDDSGNPTEGIAEVIIAKQRNGPTGSVQLAFVKEYASFENLQFVSGDGAF